MTAGWLRDNIQRHLRRERQDDGDVGHICLVCAWRTNCKKRFSLGGDVTLHCPDFTRDVLLDKELGSKKLDVETEGN